MPFDNSTGPSVRPSRHPALRDAAALRLGCYFSSRLLKRPVEWAGYCRDCRPGCGDSLSLRLLSSPQPPA